MAGALGGFLVAAGAALYWVVGGGGQGGATDLIGVAVMMVGVAGLVWSLLPPRPAAPGHRDDDLTIHRAFHDRRR